MSLLASSPFSLVITWEPPLVPNGVILSYAVTISLVNTSQQLFNLTASGPTAGDRFLIGNLNPYRTVSISVAASTAIGSGPRALLTATTEEYGEIFLLC